jgi:tRNA A37 methylthiotransferase MiaB
MNILLVEPDRTKSWGANNQYIGLLRIAAFHKAKGDQVEYIKGCGKPRQKPEMVYVTSMFTYWYKKAWEAVRYYKKLYPKAKIMLGGIYATLCPDHAKQSGADEIMVGQHPEAKFFAPDPTVLPEKPDFIYLMTSYGCPNSCSYCATHLLYGSGIKQTPYQEVFDEIKIQHDRGFRKIYFGDDNLTYTPEDHLIPLCEMIIKNGLKIEFSVPGGMQASYITKDLAKLMWKAGFRKVSTAIESTNEAVLSKMGRRNNSTKDDLVNCIDNFEAAGFKRHEIDVYFIIGMPYQTLDDILDTLTFLIKLRVWAHPQRWTPIPGTLDYKRHHLEGWDLEDLYYKSFLIEGVNFTDADLDFVYSIARLFNIGSRYTNGESLFINDRIHNSLLEKFTLSGGR